MMFEAIKYQYDVTCKGCQTRLARRGTLSVAYDEATQDMIWSNGGMSMDELEAIYELTCPKCGTVLELDYPGEVKVFLTPEPDLQSGPPVVKRR